MGKYIASILIWVVGASIGFGGSQLLFITPIKEQLREHAVRVNVLERDNDLNGREHADMREDFTRRLTTLAGEQANYVSISREFIQASKADRDLMIAQMKQTQELIEILRKKTP